MQHLQPNTTLQGGKYRIERVLGQGGFGITYLATQTSLNRYVAIKELFIGGSGQAINDRKGNQVVVTNSANQQSFNQQKAKFKKEALRLANLNHPNLVKVHEFFEENGTAYYVMDYIDGESLRTKINREGKLSESLVLKYINQILPALEVAHKQSIWHLDIKPENIMVDKYGHVYLIDFGASKHVEPNSTLTTSLALAYTPGYCPPELLDLSNETPEYYLQAIKDIGPWTDIYALGATIYNLLTDSIPPSKRRLDKEGRRAFSFPSNVSSSTRDLIVWMMKPDREDRPQNITELLSRFGEKTIIDYSNKKDGDFSDKEYAQSNDKIKNIQRNNAEQVQYGNTVNSSRSTGIAVLVLVLSIAFICVFVYNGSSQEEKGDMSIETTESNLNKDSNQESASDNIYKQEEKDDEFAFDPWSGKLIIDGGIYRGPDTESVITIEKNGRNEYSGEINLFLGYKDDLGRFHQDQGAFHGRIRGKATDNQLTIILDNMQIDNDPGGYIEYYHLEPPMQIFRITYNNTGYSVEPVGKMGGLYEGMTENTCTKI